MERWANQPAGGTEDDGEAALAPVIPLLPPPPVLDFTTFYRAELPRLTALAAALAGAAHAEEIAQEALLRAHREWPRIERYDRPGAWARRVALNLARSRMRRTSSEARALARAARQQPLAAPPPDIEEVWAHVRALPERQATAVALFYLGDLSIADLAEAMGCAEGTAKAHLFKARQALARRLTSTEDP